MKNTRKTQPRETRIPEIVRSSPQSPKAIRAYERLLALRGKVRFSRTLEEMKEDR